MRLRVIFIGHNTQDFIRDQKAYREAFVRPGVTIEVCSVKGGPETIERELDEVEAGPWILAETISAEKEGADAVIIDCAMDPCLQGLRQSVSIPVIGAGIAAFSQAILLGDRFSIISPLTSLVSAYRRRINEYCLSGRLASIRTISIPILNLLSEEAVENFIIEGKKAVDEDGADVLVIGCTGMSPVVPALKTALPIPVVDPVAASIGFAVTLIENDNIFKKLR